MSRCMPFVARLSIMLALFMAACSGSGATGGTSSGGSTTASATATQPPAPTKTKPTAVPTTTVALCAGWVSIAEANQILSPKSAFAAIVPGHSDSASSCQYESTANQFPLFYNFLSYPAGTQLSTYAAEAAAQNYAGAKISISQAVTGVGDQAWFLAGTESQGGLNAKADVLYVVDGSILIIINNFDVNGAADLGSSDDGTIQSEFIQIGNLIVSRL
jgi:hypothetical protein